MQCGTVLLKSKTGHHEKVLEHFRNLGVDHEEWDTDTLKGRIPYYDVHEFWPPSRPKERTSGESRMRNSQGRSTRAVPAT